MFVNCSNILAKSTREYPGNEIKILPFEEGSSNRNSIRHGATHLTIKTSWMSQVPVEKVI